MTTAAPDGLGGIVAALCQSPMFQLSLSSKELFHSNFLAWLCQSHPKEMARVWGAMLDLPPEDCEPLPEEVAREQKNFDLWLKFTSGRALVVENKVKSLPAEDQLTKYVASVAKDREQTRFLLLSLAPPPFSAVGDWIIVDYRRLADQLANIVTDVTIKNAYHGALLTDYVEFIGQLVALQEHFSLNWSDDESDFFVTLKDRKRLEEIRIHDVVDKLRYSEFASRLIRALKMNGFDVTYKHIPDGPPGDVAVWTDMTRGAGLCDFKYVLANSNETGGPLILGVQVQGRQFRLTVEMDSNANLAEKAARALLASRMWFDFAEGPGTGEEGPKTGSLNNYSKVFWYRYKKLEKISPQLLLGTIVKYANRLRAKAPALQEQLATISK